MFSLLSIVCLLSSIYTTNALIYDPEYVEYNLNTNQTATNPIDYWGAWENHVYNPSPKNWRFPFYTIFLDRFGNGDPTNDDANGTQYEHALTSNQFRNGGDVQGLLDSLDYLSGMGIKGLYLAGSPFINQPWAADSYSPLDLSLLDMHFGNITAWQNVIAEIHARGMYVVLDNTMATLGDLIGFEGYLNTTTPFLFGEHNGVWKSDRRYLDFDMINKEYTEGPCDYPRYWTEFGEMIGSNVTSHFKSCLQSDFDQYGDVSSFGTFPEWQKQLSKFGFVQDRLRDWRPSVLNKLKMFSCMALNQLDFDGYRIDKALTTTVDAQASWSAYMRECANKLNKTNFFIPGEIVSGNIEAAIYLGRGKEPQMAVQTLNDALTATSGTNDELYIREANLSALDSAAFHYSVYRSMCRFLSLDGVYAAIDDTPVDWVDGWNEIMLTNDLVNANTGEIDPRHLYGVTNQDVFRWPAITNGTERNILGLYVTSIILPGIPVLMWGEEQADYVLENTASNYLFGRKPMTSNLAWQIHGCYNVGTDKYPYFPLDAALYGCDDDEVSLDHRDPSHPVRNVIKRMFALREEYPVLNDGFNLSTLSKTVHNIYQPGSQGTPTELGLYSVLRSRAPTQDFTNSGGKGNQSVWLLYSNENHTIEYTFDCSTNNTLLAPFDQGTTVRNLFYPYEQATLTKSIYSLGLEGSTALSGCLDSITMDGWDFKAFVPIDQWVAAAPTITKFVPGHDYRLESGLGQDSTETVPIEVHFSTEMNCSSVLSSITIESNTNDGSTPTITNTNCSTVATLNETWFNGVPATMWKFTANLTGVAHGVHSIIVSKPESSGTNVTTTGAVDRFLLRVGMLNNPMVFPFQANYSTDVLQKYDNGSLYINHHAAGATMFRYSTDWSSSYSDWMPFTGANTTVVKSKWSGTKMQEWSGEHIFVQYWSKLSASSNHVQYGDLNQKYPQRWPHMYVQGTFNQFSYDTGIPGTMKQLESENGTWVYDLMYEWPTSFQLNQWGINPDGRPDVTIIMGDIDNDNILDRLPPGSLIANLVNITDVPPSPYVAWRISVDDGTLKYKFIGAGSRTRQITLFILLWIIPLLTAFGTVYAFMKAFYKINFNQLGANQNDAKPSIIPLALRRKFKKAGGFSEKALISMVDLTRPHSSAADIDALAADAGGKRRTVLIATMEYDVTDWDIKIKIGGLGVMAKLMGQNLGHQDLIWVVPCVGGIEYPIDQVAESMFITVLDKEYEVQVQYHVLRNITYVLLDAPIFRKQSKAEPYPARMDDLESAIYYSAWNQCIAEAATRFNVDIYHINDYHGAAAPLYLLPKVIPCCLSLHNAEFQGLWPMRNSKESAEVCSVFHLDPAIVQKYVQFGEVFNLLHAGASYLRVHQKGFGAVGVSKKYGKRSFARYPIFWGLSKIGSLPNPDPDDTAEWSRDQSNSDHSVVVNEDFEAARPELKRQAQEWAGLEQRADAELFVFVGRWSMQKGIDLIADVFPSILENYPKVQLICIGPVIDLYGRFAAMKLDKMMTLYPGRVYSKPEFTALPPFIFSGSEFALIPSRDEPFGLVAVEFGRKGALGVGAKVGGLGQMPGWWYSVESMTPKHLVHQFKMAIHEALGSNTKTRAMMRARSAEQRFPVAQWIEDLEILQTTSIKVSMHENVGGIPKSPSMANLRNLFVHGNSSKTSITTQQRHGSTLSVPGTPATPTSGPWTPMGGTTHMPSPGLMPMHTNSPAADDVLLPPPITPLGMRDSISSRRFSTLSYDSVAGERTDFQLQNVDPSFTDAEGTYLKEFERKLEKLGGKSSENLLSIESNLIKSEKKFFNSYRDAKMGGGDRNSSRPGTGFNSRATSMINQSRPGTPLGSVFDQSHDGSLDSTTSERLLDAFPLGADYQPPTGLKRWLLHRVGDWPIYSILLAFGQIIAANSYQVTLLIGEIGETATQLYIVATIYAISSLLWWWVFRNFHSVYVLSLPFSLYGIAFLLIGLGPFASSYPREWIQYTATGLYSVASSSGSFFFALNFGDEGGAPIKSWVLRACIVQGTQTIYISALWYWGASLVKLGSTGAAVSSAFVSDIVITAVTIPVAVFMWIVGIMLFIGLPNYYRQAPGKVPSFYRSLFRRKIIVWFFIYVLIQNYFLSAPYGRNWRYLWTTNHAPAWAIAILVLFFFLGLWIASLAILSRLSKSHSWILPVFAIGLGAPRWCQMLWGTSQMGQYLPWAGSALASTLLGRSLWLWLGLLDALQGVGFGMILLQTMTRFHISFTLIAAQILGSIATILARLTAPDSTGPGSVFPNLAIDSSGLEKVGFWLALLLQIMVCVGFAAFFRKEQLSKP